MADQEEEIRSTETAEPSGTPEKAEQGQVSPHEPETSPARSSSEDDKDGDDGEVEAGEISPEEQNEAQAAAQPSYQWCKIYCQPTDHTAQDHYYMHFESRETMYTEPTEPYWIWDSSTNNVHECGLQQPSNTSAAAPTASTATASTAVSSEPAEEYQGYNPKIHGSYDPNAPYAQYHAAQREKEAAISTYGSLEAASAAQASVAAAQAASASTDYSATAAFNRFSGGFQTADKSAERHSDYAKSGRQMGAFFDVDAAMNAHEGRSLKEERRQQRLSKKEIKEMKERRRERKEKKRLDFYKS